VPLEDFSRLDLQAGAQAENRCDQKVLKVKKELL
jgi:hypothetical protein